MDENGGFVDDLAVEDVDVHSHVSLLDGLTALLAVLFSGNLK